MRSRRIGGVDFAMIFVPNREGHEHVGNPRHRIAFYADENTLNMPRVLRDAMGILPRVPPGKGCCQVNQEP